MINCIETLGGKLMRKRLIQALLNINDELKGQLIVDLGQLEGDDIGNGFLDLLEQRDAIASHVRHDLLLKLCVKLKFYPSCRAMDCLKELINERRNSFGDADKIVRVAATSLQAIEIKMKNGADSQTGTVHAPASTGAPIAYTAGGDGFCGQRDGGKMPFYAGQGHHLMVWSTLYEKMSIEEVNDFFALLKPIVYQANDEIVHQGDGVTDLFFIDSGFAGITHFDEHHEILLTSLQTGDLIGGEGFSRNRKWSVSLVAQTELQVRMLERQAFTALARKYPGLEEKLRYYCNHYDIVPYLLNISDDDRQQPIGGTIVVCSAAVFLDASGEPVDDMVSGTLWHVGRGGYCFSLSYVHEGNPVAILGRQVSSSIGLTDGSRRTCFGVIAGAGRHDWNDREIFAYVKFYHPLEKAGFICDRVELM